MKAKMVPVRFRSGNDEKFYGVLNALKQLYAAEVEFLEPVMAGEALPDADGVLLPNMEADVYTDAQALGAYRHLPLVVLTTKFGVSLMFDWEAVAYLKHGGFQVHNPHSVELAKTVFGALALRRAMKQQKFLIFQDTPGDGLIPEQFKIFYWWNEQCTNDIYKKFGITIVRKPFKALGEQAKAILDEKARAELARWNFPHENVPERALLGSIKLFMALRDEVDAEGGVAAVGVNCLNEAYDSDTTPCLAYSLLYKERGVLWGLESDTSALMTQYLFGSVMDCAAFTTNIYPFLSGMPALSHEKIQSFPQVEDPDDHALLVHCGFLGCSLCQKHATRWVLKPPVLGWLVGENSTAIDADVALGDITLCKLHGDFSGVQLQKAVLEKYVQYEGSDCRNGGLIRVADGYRMMKKICSHHVVVLAGKRANQLRAVAEIFGLGVDEI